MLLGGESGVPFSLQVDSFSPSSTTDSNPIHCAGCQIKVFKVSKLKMPCLPFSPIVIFLKDTPISFLAVLDKMIYMLLFFLGVVCNEDELCICQK